MSDKQCRYAHVRILENNDARVVVHWRYALADILYQIPNSDPNTGWGDWADEYYVIYPDAVTVRHQVIWTDNWGGPLNTANWIDGAPWHQFQETILFNQPGTKPEDNVDPAALTVASLDGDTYTCVWGKDEDIDYQDMEIFKKVSMQMVNLRSEYKPFTIFEPGVIIDPWVEEDHLFWNHWPVAQLPSDGRWAPYHDRPSHTSLSCGAPVTYKGKGNSHEAVMLYGLSNSTIKELLPLARSWNQAPRIEVRGATDLKAEYDKFQRAYVISGGSPSQSLVVDLAANADHPLVNPAIVIKNWGEDQVKIRLNGQEAEAGSDYRIGYEHKLEGTDLVLWFEMSRSEQSMISIATK
jgi:hypothetical protein